MIHPSLLSSTAYTPITESQKQDWKTAIRNQPSHENHDLERLQRNILVKKEFYQNLIQPFIHFHLFILTNFISTFYK